MSMFQQIAYAGPIEKTRATRAKLLTAHCRDFKPALNSALSNNEFVIRYHPVFCAQTKAIVGIEAFLRWESKRFSSLSPDTLIAVLEEEGLVYNIGRWMFASLFEQCKSWNKILKAPVQVSIAVSLKQIADPAFVPMLVDRLQHAGISPDCLQLQLRESDVFCSTDSLLEKMDEIRVQGMRLAIEGLGSSFAKLQRMVTLPVEGFKLDVCALPGLGIDENVNKTVANLIKLADIHGKQVIAVGIERNKQMFALRETQCYAMQGALLAPPQSAEAMTSLLRFL